MTPVYIGKNLIRITIESKRKRERLARLKGVRVEGKRVIYPVNMAKEVEKLIGK